ncbi:hypothetical protein ACLOJK_007390 [Asimina triloba]
MAAAAAATRLLLLRSPPPPPPPLFRNFRNAARSLSLTNIPLHPPLRPLFLPHRPRPKPFYPHRFHFHFHPHSTAAADAPLTEVFDSPAGAVGEASGAAAPVAVDTHPWSEWETFIEQLNGKGYFDAVDADSPAATEDGSASAALPKDFHRVKAGCMNFARQRFDILKYCRLLLILSLSKKDIHAVVESGCPNLLRKAVNSAKRLRAYVRLEEGEEGYLHGCLLVVWANYALYHKLGHVMVCSDCNLRGSCDRAYVIAKEDEAARTVDVVRVLLSYAMDPLVLSGGEKPPGREHVESSACRLLSQLIELSDTSPDPSLPKPAVMTPIERERKIRDRDRQFLNVEMKKGDWICSKCNFMNFARNIRCLQCKEGGPKKVSSDEVEMKKGDWTCPQCQFLNFARNKNCLRCQESRPKRVLNPGEWECLSCDFLNYRRNMVCLKCNCKRPKDNTEQYEDRIWQKPNWD